jgi:hypothetical protein
MEMRKRFRLLVLLLIVCSVRIAAQSFTVDARVDSAQLWIGQQASIHFEITHRKNIRVQSPIFSDVIIPGVELVSQKRTDSLKSPDGLLIVKESYVITSFEDSLYLIPAFPFVAGDDTVWSPSLSLKVIQPFVIDTTSQQIADIKDVLKPRLSLLYILKKLLPWLAAFWLIVIIALLIVYLVKRRKNKVEKIAEFTEPAHVIALRKLEDIRQEKAWTQGRYKEYHTAITDVLREYIDSVYELPAMEMTSDEIITHLSFIKSEQASAYTSLRQLLQLADLVKFAKWVPLPEENENSLIGAVMFVNQTKTVEEKKEDDIS